MTSRDTRTAPQRGERAFTIALVTGACLLALGVASFSPLFRADALSDYEKIVFLAPSDGEVGPQQITWTIPKPSGWAKERFNTLIEFESDPDDPPELMRAANCRQAMEFYMFFANKVTEFARTGFVLEEAADMRSSWYHYAVQKCSSVLPSPHKTIEKLGRLYRPDDLDL